jgi:hypothetical protein
MNIAAASPSWAAIITAGASLITAFGGLVLAFTVLIPLLKTSKDTHKIVNQQRTDMMSYNRALLRALKNANVEVPQDQSLPEDGKES